MSTPSGGRGRRRAGEDRAPTKAVAAHAQRWAWMRLAVLKATRACSTYHPWPWSSPSAASLTRATSSLPSVPGTRNVYRCRDPGAKCPEGGAAGSGKGRLGEGHSRRCEWAHELTPQHGVPCASVDSSISSLSPEERDGVAGVRTSAVWGCEHRCCQNYWLRQSGRGPSRSSVPPRVPTSVMNAGARVPAPLTSPVTTCKERQCARRFP